MASRPLGLVRCMIHVDVGLARECHQRWFINADGWVTIAASSSPARRPARLSLRGASSPGPCRGTRA